VHKSTTILFCTTHVHHHTLKFIAIQAACADCCSQLTLCYTPRQASPHPTQAHTHHLVLLAAQRLLGGFGDLKGLHVRQLIEGHLVTGNLQKQPQHQYQHPTAARAEAIHGSCSISTARRAASCSGTSYCSNITGADSALPAHPVALAALAALAVAAHGVRRLKDAILLCSYCFLLCAAQQGNVTSR